MLAGTSLSLRPEEKLRTCRAGDVLSQEVHGHPSMAALAAFEAATFAETLAVVDALATRVSHAAMVVAVASVAGPGEVGEGGACQKSGRLRSVPAAMEAPPMVLV